MKCGTVKVMRGGAEVIINKSDMTEEDKKPAKEVKKESKKKGK